MQNYGSFYGVMLALAGNSCLWSYITVKGKSGPTIQSMRFLGVLKVSLERTKPAPLTLQIRFDYLPPSIHTSVPCLSPHILGSGSVFSEHIRALRPGKHFQCQREARYSPGDLLQDPDDSLQRLVMSDQRIAGEVTNHVLMNAHLKLLAWTPDPNVSRSRVKRSRVYPVFNFTATVYFDFIMSRISSPEEPEFEAGLRDRSSIPKHIESWKGWLDRASWISHWP
ncbi:hypothetical protein B0H11DRAFT_2251934 [Mycena galericulata]|nr:hypothetical protein B0H11DRAFT_2251934 [Mycena galericulata]